MTGFISKDTCETWNMLYNTGSEVAAIARSSDSTYETVKAHVTRECDHFKPFGERKRVYSDECEAITEAVKGVGRVNKEIRDRFNRSQTTLNDHATSRCRHDTPEVQLSDYLEQEDCNKMRRDYGQEKTYSEIAEDFDIGIATAKKHIQGECEHDDEVKPVDPKDRCTNVNEDMCIYARYCYYEEAMQPEDIVEEVADFFNLEKKMSVRTADRHIRFQCSHN